VSGADARISVFDNALLYAEGLFETFLAVDDRIILLEQHLDRLYRGAKVIGLTVPVSRKTLSTWMVATVKAHPDRIKKLRLTISSGEAARWVGVQGKPQVILSASPHELPVKPYSLLVSDLKIDHESVFRRIKTISYAIHAAALKRAKDRGFDDALLLNRSDRLAEVTSANIFWVRKGRLYTPPLSAGCLDGVTRLLVIREARGLGLTLVEKTDRLEGIAGADEVFVSSSLKLILGVDRIRSGRRVFRFPIGPITTRLFDHFRKLVD